MVQIEPNAGEIRRQACIDNGSYCIPSNTEEFVPCNVGAATSDCEYCLLAYLGVDLSQNTPDIQSGGVWKAAPPLTVEKAQGAVCTCCTERVT